MSNINRLVQYILESKEEYFPKIEREALVNIPNILYFGSSYRLKELKDRVFLTPYIGVASLFIINIKDIESIKGYSCNIDYLEWGLPDEKLIKPLTFAHMTHNIKEVTQEEKGVAEGFIYKIDISNFKDKLSLFTTKDSNREVVYNGKKALPIIEIIPHKLKWICNFSKENVEQFGYGAKNKVLKG